MSNGCFGELPYGWGVEAVGPSEQPWLKGHAGRDLKEP